MNDRDFLEAHRQRTLDEHINVGRDKPMSYLPIKTIERVLGITVSDYRSRVEALGHKCAIFGAEACCIKSGAVYAYSDKELHNVLADHAEVLSANGWPTTSDEFVRRVASEWVEGNEYLAQAIKAAFGESVYRTVARGTWFYDGVVPYRIRIVAVPARFAGSRYDDSEELDEATPIPQTPDGNVYYVHVTGGGKFLSLQAAKSWADAQPWGPVTWDAEIALE